MLLGKVRFRNDRLRVFLYQANGAQWTCGRWRIGASTTTRSSCWRPTMIGKYVSIFAVRAPCDPVSSFGMRMHLNICSRVGARYFKIRSFNIQPRMSSIEYNQY